jgi:hypothetical protein
LGTVTSYGVWNNSPEIENLIDPLQVPFTLWSNKKDAPAPQPPHFSKYPLRPEQQRSLGWMLRQEASTETFLEEEVSEDVLAALRWRAEGRAVRQVGGGWG